MTYPRSQRHLFNYLKDTNHDTIGHSKNTHMNEMLIRRIRL